MWNQIYNPLGNAAAGANADGNVSVLTSAQ